MFYISGSYNVIMACARKFRSFSRVIISIMLAVLVVSCCRSRSISEVTTLNDRPIIGVMTQATPSSLLEYGSTYLPATYVKFIESAGARVVPILVNQSLDYYEHLFNSINGVLLPGGGLDNLLDSGYGRAGKMFYNLAVKSNQDGDYFPIWGTCQGFELLVSLAAGKNVLASLESIDKNLDIELSPGYLDSKLLSDASENVLNALTTKAVAYNYHHFSLTPANYSKSVNLSSTFNVLSTSKNAKEEVFISMAEAKYYPFYAVQFHPEKPLFAWAVKTSIKHDSTSIMVSEYFANFFVNEDIPPSIVNGIYLLKSSNHILSDFARLSNHKFANHQEEQDASIFNHQIVYLRGKENLDQAYFFNTSFKEI